MCPQFLMNQKVPLLIFRHLRIFGSGAASSFKMKLEAATEPERSEKSKGPA